MPLRKCRDNLFVYMLEAQEVTIYVCALFLMCFFKCPSDRNLIVSLTCSRFSRTTSCFVVILFYSRPTFLFFKIFRAISLSTHKDKLLLYLFKSQDGFNLVSTN